MSDVRRTDQAPRFVVPKGSLDGPSIIRLSPGEARHARVRRLQIGDRVELLDGAGDERAAEIVGVGSDGVRVRLLGPGAHRGAGEPPTVCVLVQGIPVKLQRMDTIVRMATEVGATAIIATVAARSQVPAGGDPVLVRRAERWRRIAESAAKQSRRARIPDVSDPVGFDRLPWAELPSTRILLDPAADDAVRLGEVLGRPAPDDGVALLVGPEGGWSEAECDEAVRRGALPVRVGPRILRADTAGVVSLATVLHAWGDLG